MEKMELSIAVTFLICFLFIAKFLNRKLMLISSVFQKESQDS
jgi:hypothetical protein